MHADVVDLRDFYRSPLGQVARRMVNRRLREIWPTVAGLSVLGLGYATPFLGRLAEEAERVVVCMPATQGVLAWPPDAPNRATIGEEGELPFPGQFFDRILIAHALEGSEQVRPMLREAWRVLAGGGRLIIVVPNRRGLWARRDMTPFGYGHPYSAGQLSRLLRDCLFTPAQTTHALFVPPFRWRVLHRSALAWERAGERWFPRFAGVVIIEATKQIYAVPPVRAAARKRERLAAPVPMRPIGARRSDTPPAEPEAP
ncbi:methyltransferase family protein [Stella humosa]|uniref:Methyltransferase family protein n=1 Tax=Stella humosa TaxID=94 RepID=A0A3N1LLP8_9PROT|nr:class I SAM-dependent methyltransferase [Stella humosa]ROP91346.1 methyltransferase family protein [Stella humosa]BBK34297.1 methyltransferase type 11 [Stella humosa]